MSFLSLALKALFQSSANRGQFKNSSEKNGDLARKYMLAEVSSVKRLVFLFGMSVLLVDNANS